ncbi:MAG: FIST C-terminal domain-containing protein [Aliarcobacter sp.]|nr:FIST C-terminal domain-containing protein [Aliarcobacter sp.]
MNINFKYFDNQDNFLEYAVTNKKVEYLILVASSTIITLENFNNKNIKIFGAIFSHIIYKNKLYEKGLLLIEINDEFNLDFIENITDYIFDRNKFSESKSIITILDGFGKYNEEFLIELFENISFETNIIGGGAGVLEEKTKKVFFSNKGFSSNSAILLSFKNKKIKISSKHGWDYLSGPFIVTSCEKNFLKSIDYIDAFEVYKNVIKNDCNIELTKDNFLEISKNYPIEIVKYAHNNIVRDPISFENGKLVLVAQIKINSIINILKGNKSNLINSANQVAKEVINKDTSLLMVFNCITRKNFLEENFEDELASIYKEISPNNMIGVITIGEIANDGNKYINILNKTCVIGGI